MATLQIVQTLESLDEQLRGLEEHGRDLELKIRSSKHLSPAFVNMLFKP